MPFAQPVNITSQFPTALVRWADQHTGPWNITLPGGRHIQLLEVRKGCPILIGTDNLNAARTVGAAQVWRSNTQPDGLDGQGVGFGLFEGNSPYAPHPELTGRCVAMNTSYGAHTTHVAGTLIALGLKPAAKGMASAATINSYSWNNDYLTLNSMPSSISITNHSYGLRVGWDFNTRGDNRWLWTGDPLVSATEDINFGRYDATAVNWDTTLFQNQNVLVCRSAGNDRLQGPTSQPVEHWVWNNDLNEYELSTTVRQLDGGDTGYRSIHDASCAKNDLTIGSVADITTPITDETVLAPSYFSSCGPTDDGRIKPDICGNGEALTSCSIDAQNNPIYAIMTGTSMASPSVAGGLALVVQKYRQLHPNTVLAAPSLKAIAIHTARGNTAGPTYRTGWGVLSVQSAVQMLDNETKAFSQIVQTSLNQGQTRQWSVYHPGGDMRATICWADPPAVEQTTHNDETPRLIVDLDLRITGAAGTLYPWTLNPSQPELPAVKGDNSRDNVERIDAVGLPAGNYTISVNSKNMPTQYSPFAFSLVMSGIGHPAGRVLLQVTPNQYIGNLANVPVTLKVAGPNGYNTVRSTDMQNTLEMLELPQGSYQFTLTSPHFLQRIVRVDLGDAETNLNTVMINGDADGSGSINLFDLVALDRAFGSSVDDLNGDDIVNLFDYVVIDGAFGAQSDK